MATVIASKTTLININVNVVLGRFFRTAFNAPANNPPPDNTSSLLLASTLVNAERHSETSADRTTNPINIPNETIWSISNNNTSRTYEFFALFGALSGFGFAGTPTTVSPADTSLVTTEPAPVAASCPM